MIMPEDSEIEEKEPGELEKLTYGKTILILLNRDGNYQIEKRNPQGTENIIDYAKVGTNVKGTYNARLEDAFERIRQVRSHITQFDKEKQNLALRVDDLDLGILSKEPGNLDKPPDNLDKPVASVLEKPMVFHIVRKEKFTCDLDYLTIDETV